MATFSQLLSLMLIVASLGQFAYAQPQVSCLFHFGDSLFDNGNSNLLPTSTKANYRPYGIDFPDRIATGRFSNGLNTADFIAQLLGFTDFIPPFATAQGPDILKGVNYASGVAGIRDESGQQLGVQISLNQQLLNHQVTLLRVSRLIGNTTARQDYLKKCIYTVNIGSSDYVFNYLMPQYYPTSRLYNPDQYASVLIQQYSQQLRILYRNGARKVAVFGLGLIGCTPFETTLQAPNPSGCVDSINADIQLFNNRLPPLVDDFNNIFSDARFTFINNTGNLLGNPAAAGITVLNAPCCPVSNSTGQCLPNQTPCSDRRIYAFWDALRPTEIANFLFASKAYSSPSPTDVHPVNIMTLAQM